MKLISGIALAALSLAAAPVMAQTALNATFTGTLTTSQLNPVPGQQTFTLTGGFLTYVASSDLPQIGNNNGINDIAQYSFTLTGTSQAYDDATRTTTYGNITGSINAYGRLVQSIYLNQLTATFDPTFSTAALLGGLFSTGPQNPFGLGPVDLSPANGAVVAGTYVSGGPQRGTVTGSITFPNAVGDVPEPATWGMMILGFGMAGAAIRRRRTVALAA